MIAVLSPDEAAEEWLGWTGKRKGRKLMRWVLKAEKRLGHEIAMRVHGEGKGTRYRLKEPTVRLYLPELFTPCVDSLAIELSAKIESLRATIGATVDERMAPQVQKIRAEHARLQADVMKLTTSVEDGFGRLERRLSILEKEKSP